MKRKKIVYIVLLILFIILIGLAIFNNIDVRDNKNENEITEYVPEEEISEEQNRRTIVTLYFVDPSTDTLIPEARNLDAKELLENPYEKVANLLIEGSENEMVGKSIPEGTILNKVSLNGEEIIIDFNEKFVENADVHSEEFLQIVYSIVDTELEFSDVSSVSFLINGEKFDGLQDSFTKREN